MENIVAQNEQNVKLNLTDLGLEECEIEWCHELIFRRGLCWDHFIEGEIQEEDDQERWDPALDGAWRGYPMEEVCGDDHYLQG